MVARRRGGDGLAQRAGAVVMHGEDRPHIMQAVGRDGCSGQGLVRDRVRGRRNSRRHKASAGGNRAQAERRRGGTPGKRKELSHRVDGLVNWFRVSYSRSAQCGPTKGRAALDKPAAWCKHGTTSWPDCKLLLPSASATVCRMSSRRVVVAGGGAAGFFAAITCAQTAPDVEVTLLEKGPQFLSKVRISGGGRCNVTHACFEAREFASHYPRGEQALIGPFRSFQASDTVVWFESRGVKLKTERDGRMFPTTDSSQTIIDCLLGEAKAANVKLILNRGIECATRRPEGGFELKLTGGETLECDRLLLATGGCRVPALGQLAASLGHTLEPPVPSLFTFHLDTPWVRELAGVTIEAVEASVPGTDLRERGALLLTHWGLSGPVILRLSAWGARELHGFA